jgi:thymidylate synthase (FAD)
MSDQLWVLDRGFVRLIDHMGGDLSVVRDARVLPDAEWRGAPDEKLIRYLWTNRHTSPFEGVVLKFEVRAPIFVLRQWLRHRTQSPNEISGRYSELPADFYVPAPDQIGTQSKTNKQGRDMGARPGWRQRLGLWHYRMGCHAAVRLYRFLLWCGFPRELARCVLPLSTYSRMVVTMNLLNLLRFLTLRCDHHAQYEIRVYADAMRELARRVAPISISAWENI